MAFTLPLAKPADRLSNTRPTASILGLHTLSSAIGVLVINFAFMVIALFFLSNQDWYQCRKWGSNDVSNVSDSHLAVYFDLDPASKISPPILYAGPCHRG